MTYSILNGNCLDRLKELEDNSIDAICTDPPYGINFMGKKWDYDVPGVEIWKECLRVLKPGGHLLSFAGTRTQHRMAINIEDAGFEIREMLAWVYGSGMPKSHDVSKAIDKTLGVEREIIGKAAGMGKQNPKWNGTENGRTENYFKPEYNLTAPTSEEAKQWEGWGTALKPSMEPITMARKPLEGTVAANVLDCGTGAINIDGCRLEIDSSIDDPRLGGNGSWRTDKMAKNVYEGGYAGDKIPSSSKGRWPANLIHDGSDEVLELFPDANSSRIGNPNNPHRGVNHTATSYGQGDGKITHDYRDTGSAARFFYCAKASKKDRNEGLTTETNEHPTVKPTDLMRYLCRLITPPGGIVLDPFMGSGSTGKAALLEGFNFIGIDLDPNYCKIAEERIQAIRPPATLDELFV
jgi:site-specific DNA-methyltransferase (adenine-specific)